MTRLVKIKGEDGYVKDMDSGAVLATKKAYERWQKATRLDRKVSELDSRLSNLESAVSNMTSAINDLVKALREERKNELPRS